MFACENDILTFQVIHVQRKLMNYSLHYQRERTLEKLVTKTKGRLLFLCYMKKKLTCMVTKDNGSVKTITKKEIRI